MAGLVVLLILLGCVAYQFFKGTLAKAFVTIIVIICASVVAFGYFELLANVLISRNDNIKFMPWAQPLCFVLLFVLTFTILQTITSLLLRKKVDLGIMPERIGRVVCGILQALLLSGVLLTALAMSPIANKYPYQRFDAQNPETKKPNKVLLNADGFTTGWFSIISSGSFSGKKSFAVVHPAFLDQSFLNRLSHTDGVSILNTGGEVLEIPKKKAVWPAPEGLKDAENPNQTVSPGIGHSLTIVRIGFNKKILKDKGTFALAQLRLTCKAGDKTAQPLHGKGKSLYPVGYLTAPDRLQKKCLHDIVKIAGADFDGKVKFIDFVFYVPTGSVPVLVEFKQNALAQLPPPISSEDAPVTKPFIPLSKCTQSFAELQPLASSQIYGLELAAQEKLLTGLKIKIEDPNQWTSAQTANSIRPAKFENATVNWVRAELQIEMLEEPKSAAKTTPKKSEKKRKFRPQKKYVRKPKGIKKMFKPLEGYKLLSLKCNNPSVGAAIQSQQLPVLVEVSGLIHYPVGIITTAKIGDRNISEIDYCSVISENATGGLVIAEDGSVTKAFPDSIWLTQNAREILEFYVLYLVKSGEGAIIQSVKPADSKIEAGFQDYEGFAVK